MLLEAISTGATLLATGIVTALLLAGFTREERRLGWLSFAAHWLSSFALLWLTTSYYGGGDVLTYFRFGELLSRYIDAAPHEAPYRVGSLLIQRDVQFPFWMRGVGQATGSMNAIAGILLYFLGTKWAASGLLATVSFSGKIALYRFFRPEFSDAFRPRLAAATLLLPSVVFWTSGMVKEALAVFGIGWAILGIGMLRHRRGATAFGWLLAAGGIWVVFLVKSYLLVPLAASLAVWVSWNRMRRWRGGSVRWLIGASAAYLSIVAVGQFIPEFSFDRIGDEITRMQVTGEQAGGGSYLDIGVRSRSFAGQLLAAPVGLFAVLFRPSILEVRNAAMLINATETTAISIFILRVLLRSGARRLWSTLRNHESALLCVCFVLVAGIGIGLSSTNLGSISRYRAPLMPFYMIAILAVDFASGRRIPLRGDQHQQHLPARSPRAGGRVAAQP